MKKLILFVCQTLLQLIGYSQTSGVNVLHEKVGINLNNPTRQFEILGLDNTSDHLFYSRTNSTKTLDIRAIEGFSAPATGYGYGGYFTGGYRRNLCTWQRL